MAPRRSLLIAPLLAVTAIAQPVFNITDFGAVGDNATLNTPAIQATIDAAAAVGGGIVAVPAGGVFLTATIGLRSNVILLLEGVLQGSANLEDYTAVSGPDWDTWDVLHTTGASNVGIIGGGALVGPMWQMVDGYNAAQNQFVPRTWAGSFGCEGECRPRLLVFVDCANVTVSGVRLLHSADWTQLYRRCTNVTLANVTVWGSQQWPNNDGVDFESCSDVVVRGSSFFTGDDGIVLASGNCNNMRVPWPEPWGNYTPTARVRIEDCTISSYSSGIKYEAIFQAWHGDVTDVAVRNVTIHDSARGIGFQQRTGGGAARNWSFTDVTVSRTKGITGSDWWGDGEALWLTTLPEGPSVNFSLGGLHDLTFTNVRLEGEQGGLVINRNPPGAGGSISGLLLDNVTLVVGVFGNATRPGLRDLRPVDAGGGPSSEAANVTGWWFEHVAGAAVRGGGVQFAGAPQPWWARGVCQGATPDSNVSIAGMACAPAA